MAKKPILVFGDMNVAYNEIDIYNHKRKEKLPGFTRE
jgi:exonuclease III